MLVDPTRPPREREWLRHPPVQFSNRLPAKMGGMLVTPEALPPAGRGCGPGLPYRVQHVKKNDRDCPRSIFSCKSPSVCSYEEHVDVSRCTTHQPGPESIEFQFRIPIFVSYVLVLGIAEFTETLAQFFRRESESEAEPLDSHPI